MKRSVSVLGWLNVDQALISLDKHRQRFKYLRICELNHVEKDKLDNLMLVSFLMVPLLGWS